MIEYDEIIVERRGDRGVVTEAPPRAYIATDLLAEVALGRGIDSHVDDLGLTLGVEGMGVGVVRYEVGDCDYENRRYPLVRLS